MNIEQIDSDEVLEILSKIVQTYIGKTNINQGGTHDE